jgi:hypothetical protein
MNSLKGTTVGKFAIGFIVHSVIATVGAFFGGTVLGFLLALPIGLFSSGPGNIVDRVSDSWIIRYSFKEPYFALPALTALFLGFISHRLSRSRSGAFSWIVPSAVLLCTILPRLVSSPAQESWIIDNLFSAGCGSTECLYELFITAPFCTSVAYTIGWLAEFLIGRNVEIAGGTPHEQN